MPRPCVFLDRDGVLVREVDYCDHPDRLELLPGAARAVARLNAAGVLAIVLTNQAGIARGYYDEPTLDRIHERMGELLGREGTRLDAVYYAPQHPESADPRYRDDPEELRKPGLGMIRRAQRGFPIDMGRAWMIGDKPTDIELAANAAIPGILVLTGYGRDALAGLDRWKARPAAIVADVAEAIDWVLAGSSLHY